MRVLRNLNIQCIRKLIFLDLVVFLLCRVLLPVEPVGPVLQELVVLLLELPGPAVLLRVRPVLLRELVVLVLLVWLTGVVELAPQVWLGLLAVVIG